MIDFAAEPVRQRDAKGGLANRGRSGDDHEAWDARPARSSETATVAGWLLLSITKRIMATTTMLTAVTAAWKPDEGFDRVVLRILTQSLKVITIAGLAVMVLAAGVWAFSYTTNLARPSDVGQPVMFSVFEDQTDAEVADELAKQGLIRSTLLFQGQYKLAGGALVPGTYTLRKGMSIPQIVDRITGAAPADEPASVDAAAAPESFDITIPEGWRMEQIAEEYERLGGAGGEQAFIDAVNDIDRSQFDFLADLPADESLEGYLFPDTYRFDGQDPKLDVATMLTNFGNKYTPEMRQRSQQMGLDDQPGTDSGLTRRARSAAAGGAADHRRYLPQPLGAGLEPGGRPDGAVRSWEGRRLVADATDRRAAPHPEPVQHLSERRTATGPDC